MPSPRRDSAVLGRSRARDAAGTRAASPSGPSINSTGAWSEGAAQPQFFGSASRPPAARDRHGRRAIGTGPRVTERARALLSEADPSSAPGVDQSDTDQARGRESVADVSPVPQVPRRLEELGLPVL